MIREEYGTNKKLYACCLRNNLANSEEDDQVGTQRERGISITETLLRSFTSS